MRIKIILPVLVLLSTAAVLSAQQIVKETEKRMSFGNRPCFRIEFPNANTATLEEQWKDWAKRNHDAKLKKKGGELYATDLTAKKMGGTYSVYSTIEKTTGGAALNVWFDLGESFLNSRDNPSLARDATTALEKFYYDIRRVTYDEEIQKEEEKLKQLEDQNKTMDKSALTLQKNIDGYKAKIQEAEAQIADLARNQETVLLNIEAQRRRIEEMKNRKLNVESEGH